MNFKANLQLYCCTILMFLVFPIHSMNPGTHAQMAMASQQAMFGIRIVSIADMMRQYHLAVPVFIEQSQKCQTLDWSVFQAMHENDLGISLNSYITTMGEWATKTSNSAVQEEISSLYRPLFFKKEEKWASSFAMPSIATATNELGSMMASRSNHAPAYTQLPIFNFESDLPAVKFQISITAVARPSKAALYSRIYKEVRNAQRSAIINNPELSKKYFDAVQANAQLLRAMILGESPAQRIEAQLSVNKLELIDLFKEGEVLSIVKAQIQDFLLKDAFINPAMTLEQRGKLLEMVAPFFERVAIAQKNPNFYTDFLNDCVKQTIPGAELLMARARNENSWGDEIGRYFNWFVPAYIPLPLDYKLRENTFFQDFSRLESCCKKQNFSESQAIISSYLDRIKTAQDAQIVMGLGNEVHALRIIHDHYYRQVFNEYGIKFEHTDDPYYAVAKQLLVTCAPEQKKELLSTVQNTVQIRQEKMAALFSRLKTSGRNPVVRAYAYRLIDAQSSQEIIKIVGSLSADHPESDYRAAYDTFIAHCMPKWISSGHNSVSKVHKDLSLQAHTRARILYGLCGCFEPKSKEQEQQLAQIVSYINQSCSNKEQSENLVFLGEKLYQSLTQINDQSLILKAPNFDVAFDQPEQLQLKNELISLTVDCLKKIETLKESNKDDLAPMESVLFDINTIFNDIKQQKFTKAEAWIEKVIKPAIKEGGLTQDIINSRNTLLVREILSKCSVYGEEKSLPQCFIPENKEWLYIDDYILDEPGLPYFDACLPGLIGAEKLFEWVGHSPDNPDLENVPQCNWGKQQQLPSLGESEKREDQSKNEQEVQNQEANTPGKEEIRAEETRSKESSSEENKGQESSVLETETIKIEVSKELIESLIEKYGEEYTQKILQEAIKIFPFKEYSLRNTSCTQRFEKLVKDLAKIRSVSRWSKFTEDPAQGNKVTLKVIDEAMAGIACEEMNLVGTLERSKDAGEEFVEILEDGAKNFWDVKTFPAYSNDGKRYIFNAEVYVGKIKKGLSNNEKIIINIAYLPQAETEELTNKIISNLTKEELKKIIGVDPYNDERTKKFNNSILSRA